MYPKAKLSFLPTLCMHCEDPPCLKSCPTKAITQREDGSVLINENKCTGAAACVSACPYDAIRVWEKEIMTYGEGEPTPLDAYARMKHRIGAAEKCTFCSHRMDFARENGLRPGVDREATPACVIACPVECRIFGDLEGPVSPPTKYMKEAREKGRKVFVLRPEANTHPKVVYIG